MAEYNNFYLQRMGTTPLNAAYPVMDSVENFHVWCKDIPFQVYGKVKEPAKRAWYDEHGDDEYISGSGLFMEAYTMTVELGCRAKDTVEQNVVTSTAKENVKGYVKTFLDYLRTAGMMKIYSAHTLIGRQNVRLESVSDKATWQQGEDGYWFLIFEVTFKVNDPVTDVTLSYTPSS